MRPKLAACVAAIQGGVACGAHRRRPRSRTRCCSSCSPTRASARRSSLVMRRSPTFRRSSATTSMGTYARNPVEFVRGEGTRAVGRRRQRVPRLPGRHPRRADRPLPTRAGSRRSASRRRGSRTSATSSTRSRRCGWPSGSPRARSAARCSSPTRAPRPSSARSSSRAATAPAATSWCCEGGFHGRTYGALSATPQEAKQAPFAPLVPGFKVATARRRCVEARRLEHRGRARRADPGRGGHPPAPRRGAGAPRARPATRTARC